MTALAIIGGAVFRRWYGGGWVSSAHWLRVVVGFVLAAVAMK